MGGPLFEEGLGGVLAAVLVLPGYQLAVSLVGAVIVGFTAGWEGVARIWKITWRGLVGALAGFGIMVLLFKAMK